jgi:hypothetical protein
MKPLQPGRVDLKGRPCPQLHAATAKLEASDTAKGFALCLARNFLAHTKRKTRRAVEGWGKVCVPSDYVDSDKSICVYNRMNFPSMRQTYQRYAVFALAVVQCRAVRGLVLWTRAGCQVFLQWFDTMLFSWETQGHRRNGEVTKSWITAHWRRAGCHGMQLELRSHECHMFGWVPCCLNGRLYFDRPS